MGEKGKASQKSKFNCTFQNLPISLSKRIQFSFLCLACRSNHVTLSAPSNALSVKYVPRPASHLGRERRWVFVWMACGINAMAEVDFLLYKSTPWVLISIELTYTHIT